MKKDPNKVQSIREIMEQMGFKKDAPVSTQEAFIRHLVKSAYGNVEPIKIRQNRKDKEEQLDLFNKAS